MPAGAYDEFAMLEENASEFGVPWSGPPNVRREGVGLTDGGTLSALVWAGPGGAGSETAPPPRWCCSTARR